MAIETRIDPQEIKIQDLSLESSQSTEILFDANRDITDSDKTRILESLVSFKKASGAPRAENDLYASIYYLAPAQLLHFPYENKTFVKEENLKTIIEQHLTESKPGKLAEALMMMKILFPQNCAQILKNPEIFKLLKESVLYYTTTNWIDEGVKLIKNFAICYPTEPLPEEAKQFCATAWEWAYKQYSDNKKHLNETSVLINRTAAIKYAFPELAAHWQGKLPPVKKLRDILEGWRKRGNWTTFLNVAATLQALAAERIVVEDNRIKFVMPVTPIGKPKFDAPQIKHF